MTFAQVKLTWLEKHEHISWWQHFFFAADLKNQSFGKIVCLDRQENFQPIIFFIV
jgi:hypothetical protein